MRQLLRVFCLLSALAALCLLAACAKPAAESGGATKAGGASAKPKAMTADGKPIKLGFIVKQPEEKWFQDEWKFAQKNADENGYELIKLGDKDPQIILSKIDSLGAQGCQGFVICTPDTKLGPAIVAKAKQYNMKLFSVDDRFIGADGKPMTEVPYMGISATDIGESVGKALADYYKKMTTNGGTWKPAEVAAAGITYEELDTAKLRTDGAQKALKDAGFPADKIFTKHEKTTDVPGAQDAMNALLTQHPEVKHWLVYSMNDEGVLGAVRSLEAHSFTADSCYGVGIGGSSCFAELERSTPTSFAGTVLISPKRHGYETIDMVFKWVKDGTEPAKETLTKGFLIDRTNFKEVAKREGIMD